MKLSSDSGQAVISRITLWRKHGQARAFVVMTHNPDVLDLYLRMSVIRQFEERCLELSRERFISGSIHLCLGQEAIPVGVCAALEPADRVIATYRGHGWAIARCVPLEPLLGEICQRADGLNGGPGGRHPRSG